GRSRHLLEARGPDDAARCQRFEPPGEIRRGGANASDREPLGLAEELRVDETGAATGVTARAVKDQVVAGTGIRLLEAGAWEDVLRQVLAVRHPARLLDDHAEQEIAR